jgi:hypothetical protein
MTYIKREEIFSKDYITTLELQELLGFSTLSKASAKMQEIKRKVGDRLGIKGRLHTEDYFLFFDIKTDRYIKPIQ